MRKKKVHQPIFQIGQSVRLTDDILRYSNVAAGIVYDPPIVWYAKGQTGKIIKQGNMENYYWVAFGLWEDESTDESTVVPFPVHARRLEAIVGESHE